MGYESKQTRLRFESSGWWDDNCEYEIWITLKGYGEWKVGDIEGYRFRDAYDGKKKTSYDISISSDWHPDCIRRSYSKLADAKRAVKDCLSDGWALFCNRTDIDEFDGIFSGPCGKLYAREETIFNNQ